MNRSISIFLPLLISVVFGSVTLQHGGRIIISARNKSGNPDPYIIGGEVVQGREFPGQILLRLNGHFKCGGSIVNTNYILTAAHCTRFYTPSELTVLSGTNFLDQGGTIHQVIEIHFHENYNITDSWHNDIAVLKVHPPFVFDEITAPVKLPKLGQETPEGSNATVIGWGYTSSGNLSNELRKVDIFIFDHDKCNEIYEKVGNTVHPEQICADTPDGHKGSCSGDSGGPLFVNGEVIGLVSWAKGCAIKGYPTVFTEVADYIDWIESKIHSQLT